MGWITKRVWVGKGRKEGKTRKGVVFPAGIWVYGTISLYVHTKIEPTGKYIVDKNTGFPVGERIFNTERRKAEINPAVFSPVQSNWNPKHLNNLTVFKNTCRLVDTKIEIFVG